MTGVLPFLRHRLPIPAPPARDQLQAEPGGSKLTAPRAGGAPPGVDQLQAERGGSKLTAPRAGGPVDDAGVAELAAQQDGVWARWQVGLTRHQVQHRLDAGRWHRVFHGVYAFTPDVRGRARMRAAILTFGPRAVGALRLSGYFWGLETPRGLSVICGHGRSRDGIRVHRVPLAERERAAVDGVPVTSVARTLADLANTERPRVAEKAIERAEVLRLLDVAEIARLDPRRSRRLRALLALADPGTTITRSWAEEEFLTAVRAYGLPEPVMNAPLVLPDGSQISIDAYWPRQRLAVEIDDRTHMTPQAFARDRHRDRQLTMAGIRPVRFPAREAAAAAPEVAALLASAAGRRSR